MRLKRAIPLLLAALLQVLPMLRAVLPTAQVMAPSAWTIVLKFAAGAVALLGSYHAVSAATTIVAPYTVNATNGVRYSRQLTVSGRSPGSWTANTAPLHTAVYPLSPGLYLTNTTGKIGGIPTQVGTTNVTITVWENGNNTGGQVSAPFTINVYAGSGPPYIATQPANTNIAEGKSGTFSVGVQGTMPFRYQWYFKSNNIAGATNAVLTVSNVSPADAGPYYVAVSNSLGSSNSRPATLTVLFKPVILSDLSPASQTVNVGDAITLSVMAGGTVPMGFRWRRNGMTLTNIVLNTTNAVLTITNAQAANSGTYTVVLSNAANTIGILSGSAVVTVSSGSANTPPSLNPIADQLVVVGDTLNLTAHATDDDTPAQTLAYSLAGGAPAGAAINPTNGLLTWPTAGTSAPSTNTISVRVADNGSPVLSATQSFRVVVTANRAPVLSPIPDRIADVLLLVRWTNVVDDADLPLDRLTFSLGPDAPAGARIHPATGVFRWWPSREQAGSTNLITVNVTDDGHPARGDSQTFTVVVSDYAELSLGEDVLLVGDTAAVPISLGSSTPLSNVTFNVEFAGSFSNFVVQAVDGTGAQATIISVESNRISIGITTMTGLPMAADVVAQLSFIVAGNQTSAFVPLTFSQAAVERTDGAAVDRLLLNPGRVVAIGSTPLMEGVVNSDQSREVLIYGRTGDAHVVEATTNLMDQAGWTEINMHIHGPLIGSIHLGSNAAPATFYRVH